jgi:hypothetical protein
MSSELECVSQEQTRRNVRKPIKHHKFGGVVFVPPFFTSIFVRRLTVITIYLTTAVCFRLIIFIMFGCGNIKFNCHPTKENPTLPVPANPDIAGIGVSHRLWFHRSPRYGLISMLNV